MGCWQTTRTARNQSVVAGQREQVSRVWQWRAVEQPAGGARSAACLRVKVGQHIHPSFITFFNVSEEMG